MRQNEKLIKLVTAALMAALTCTVTMAIPIKIPNSNGGYIHPGDAFVLLSGILLGPIYGGLSAGIGSMMADLLSGYVQYAPATFVIKLLAAMIGGYSFHHIRKIPSAVSVILSGVLGGIIVTLGYLLYDRFLSGNWGSATAGVPFNLLQNLMAIVIASILLPLLFKVPQIRNLNNKSKLKV
jgi:Predicted membrane protein